MHFLLLYSLPLCECSTVSLCLLMLISIWGYFRLWILSYLSFLENECIHVSWIFSRSEIGKSKVHICLVDITTWFSKVIASIFTPTYSAWGFWLFRTLLILESIFFFFLVCLILAILVGVDWWHSVVLICIPCRLIKLSNFNNILTDHLYPFL